MVRFGQTTRTTSENRASPRACIEASFTLLSAPEVAVEVRQFGFATSMDFTLRP